MGIIQLLTSNKRKKKMMIREFENRYKGNTFIPEKYKNRPYTKYFLQSKYSEESGVSLAEFYENKGRYGEGLIFIELEFLPYNGKILTNLYIPRERGMTEIDLMYICEQGIFVIESKNYSGHVSGHYKQENWFHSFPSKTYKFLNPILQNDFHLKYLLLMIGDIPLHSIVIFNNDVTFGKLDVGEHVVVKRKDFASEIHKRCVSNVLTSRQVTNLYNNLKAFNKLSEQVKREKIDEVRLRSESQKYR